MNRNRDSTVYRHCPRCSANRVRVDEVEHSFPFGSGEKAVELTATVPVHTCDACGFEYLDHVAEDRQHDAACRHLGLLTPSEVREVRRLQGMNRAEFAELTGLGEASIARWESGAGYQSVSNDRYLRLLMKDTNIEELRALTRPGEVPRHRRFRCITSSDRADFAALQWSPRKCA